jgi:WD40 repeat protein
MLALAGGSGFIELWNADTGRPLLGSPLRLDGAFEVRAVAFSPDGRWLAAGGKTADNAGLLGLWDVSVSPPRRYVTPEAGSVIRSLAFCGRGGGTRLAWNTKDELSLWPLRGTEKPRALLRKEDGRRIARIAMAPNCAHLAVGDDRDGSLELWRFPGPSLEAVRQPLETFSGLGSLAFDPTGRRLAVASTGSTLTLWDLGTLQSASMSAAMPIRSLAFRPDGVVLAAAGDTGILLLDPENLLEDSPEPLAGHNGPVSEIAFHPGGELLASVGEDGKVILWKPASDQRLGRRLAGHGQEVWAVAFSPDGRSLVSTEGSETLGLQSPVRLWDVGTGQGTELPGNLGPSRAVAFSPDGLSIVAGSRDPAGGTLALWRLSGPQGKAVAVARWNASKPVNAVTFGPDGRSLLTAEGEDLVQWTLDQKAPRRRRLSTHDGNIWSLLVRPARTLLASDETGKVIEWDLATAEPKAVLEPDPPSRQILSAVAESPEGRYVAAASWVGGDRCVDLWEMPGGTFAGCLAGHQKPVSAVAFARDDLLISADGDGLLILWEPGTRRVPQGHQINGLAATRDGRGLAAASSDGTILLLDLDWETAARQLAGRELTKQECKDWIHFEPKPASCAGER